MVILQIIRGSAAAALVALSMVAVEGTAFAQTAQAPLPVVTVATIQVEDVAPSMELYQFPTAQEQASKWLGGGSSSIAAKALAATADFQFSQKQIQKKLPDYAVAVNPAYVQEAMK